MKNYILRLGFAYLLLILASRVLKDAERILRESVSTPPAEVSSNGNGIVEAETAAVNNG